MSTNHQSAEATPTSRTAFGVLFSVVFLDNLGFAIVVPYLFFYVQALGGSIFLYGVLLASYSLTSFVFTPLIARLSDRFGRRKILLVALAIASASYLIFGMAQAIWLLFLGRILSGTTAATVPVAQAYVADVTTKDQRLRYLGLLGAAAGIAFIFGPAIGGTLSSLFGYGVPSFLASALALSNLVIAYFRLPEPAVFSIKRSVLSFRALLGTLRRRKVVLLLTIYFLFFIAFVFMQASLSPWLQRLFQFDALGVGLVFFFVGAMSVFSQAILLPTLNRKLSRLALLSIAVTFFIAGLLALSITSSLIVLLIIVPVIAFGFGIQFVSYNTLISLSSSDEAQGGTLGVAWAIAGAAQSIAPVLAASAFSWGIAIGFEGLAFLFAAFLSLATLPLIFAFKKIESE